MVAAAYKLLVTPEQVEHVRNWFANRGGMLLWHDQELHIPMRPDMGTPATHDDGSPATPPHWSMGNPEPLKPEDVGVRAETAVEGPEIRVAVRHRRGSGISYTGEMKASEAAKKLGQGVKWYVEYLGYGLAKIGFYTEKIEPFTLA